MFRCTAEVPHGDVNSLFDLHACSGSVDRNSSTYTLAQLQEVARDSGGKSPDGELMEMSPSLHLLLQFQRLLVARIFSKEMAVMTKSSETKEEEDFAKPTSEIGTGRGLRVGGGLCEQARSPRGNMWAWKL